MNGPDDLMKFIDAHLSMLEGKLDEEISRLTDTPLPTKRDRFKAAVNQPIYSKARLTNLQVVIAMLLEDNPTQYGDVTAQISYIRDNHWTMATLPIAVLNDVFAFELTQAPMTQVIQLYTEALEMKFKEEGAVK